MEAQKTPSTLNTIHYENLAVVPDSPVNTLETNNNSIIPAVVADYLSIIAAQFKEAFVNDKASTFNSEVGVVALSYRHLVSKVVNTSSEFRNSCSHIARKYEITITSMENRPPTNSEENEKNLDRCLEQIFKSTDLLDKMKSSSLTLMDQTNNFKRKSIELLNSMSEKSVGIDEENQVIQKKINQLENEKKALEEEAQKLEIQITEVAQKENQASIQADIYDPFSKQDPLNKETNEVSNQAIVLYSGPKQTSLRKKLTGCVKTGVKEVKSLSPIPFSAAPKNQVEEKVKVDLSSEEELKKALIESLNARIEELEKEIKIFDQQKDQEDSNQSVSDECLFKNKENRKELSELKDKLNILDQETTKGLELKDQDSTPLSGIDSHNKLLTALDEQNKWAKERIELESLQEQNTKKISEIQITLASLKIRENFLTNPVKAMGEAVEKLEKVSDAFKNISQFWIKMKGNFVKNRDPLKKYDDYLKSFKSSFHQWSEMIEKCNRSNQILNNADIFVNQLIDDLTSQNFDTNLISE